MRIQHKTFLLTFTVEHTPDNGIMTVAAYGANFELLPLQRKFNGNQETIEISVTLPNTVMLVLSGKNYQTDINKSIKLLGMSLAGIKINNDVWINLIDYRPSQVSEVLPNIQDYLNNEAIDPNPWEYNGCVVFNLFDPNPFAYLLSIGNKIRF